MERQRAYRTGDKPPRFSRVAWGTGALALITLLTACTSGSTSADGSGRPAATYSAGQRPAPPGHAPADAPVSCEATAHPLAGKPGRVVVSLSFGTPGITGGSVTTTLTEGNGAGMVGSPARHRIPPDTFTVADPGAVGVDIDVEGWVKITAADGSVEQRSVSCNRPEVNYGTFDG